MPGPAVDIIKQFGAVEDDQRYSRLAALFADDGVYVDPFFGPQRGRAAVTEFLSTMERVVPASGVRFESWEVEADTTCAWARWVMSAPAPERSDRSRIDMPGQSLYRLRDGQVVFAADYLDPVAHRTWRPEGPPPDFTLASGESARFAQSNPGPARALLGRFWELQDTGAYAALAELFTDDAVFSDVVYGTFSGGSAVREYLERMEREMSAGNTSFTLVDAAGDETVGWSQWTCHVPGGSFAGWTLHTLRDGKFTLDADYFDVLAARRLAKAAKQG
jgi:steroid Delta-isomerase